MYWAGIPGVVLQLAASMLLQILSSLDGLLICKYAIVCTVAKDEVRNNYFCVYKQPYPPTSVSVKYLSVKLAEYFGPCYIKPEN